MPNKSKTLREFFHAKAIVRIVGAHNGLGAKLIEKHGFDGIWASGLEISTAYALPDANILTMTEYLAAAQSMNESSQLPVVADCDTGYGNASNARHMVKKYEAAGIAAVVIEDKLFPKVNSFVPGRQELASIEEFSGKIEAAKNAQKNEDFMVFARIEALIAGWGMDEALRRAEAYANAGADGLVIHSKAKTPDEIFDFARRFQGSIPLVAIPTTYFNVSADTFAEHGFKMVIYANQGLRASIQAMNEVLDAMQKTRSTAAVENKIASMKEVFELQGMSGISEDEKKYSKKEAIQAVIPAAGDHRFQSDLHSLLADRPLCMLDIGGKTLIDRQADLLRSCGIKEITVVGGYSADKIHAEGTKLIENVDYETSGSAYSVMSAQAALKEKCVMVYSDILFDRHILERLLTSPHEITLVIDRAYRTLPFRGKSLDLVIAGEAWVPAPQRKLNQDLFKPVQKIGRKINPEKANYEFIGMAFFREEGLRRATAAWQEALIKFKGKSFYEAPSVRLADFNDWIQYLIDLGMPVHGLEIEHGWSEIHSAEDYERVNAHFKKHLASPTKA